MTPLLAIRDLEVTFAAGAATLPVICGVDLSVGRGEILGIVGESGSGKSVTMLAAMGLAGPRARLAGSVRFDGEELIGRPAETLRRLRGRRMAMIFQDPMTALDPVITIGAQIAEAVRIHQAISRRAAHERAVELLDRVAIPFPRRRALQYPHEFSGGMRQRAMIAMAIANDPELIIADEPTTALDVTVQAQILELLAGLVRDRGVGLALITHDLGVVAGLADRVAIMYAGRVVEAAPVREAFYAAAHPYTRNLIRSLPRIDGAGGRLVPIEGSPPSIAARPPGCAFHPRCDSAVDACRETLPRLAGSAVHRVACLRATVPAAGEGVA